MTKFTQTYQTDLKYTEWQLIERTFGWFGRYRRLARDYEHTTSCSEAMVYLASIRRTLKVVTKPKTI
jgi:transposase